MSKNLVRKKPTGDYINQLKFEKIIVVNYINKTTVEQISMYYYGEGVNI